MKDFWLEVAVGSERKTVRAWDKGGLAATSLKAALVAALWMLARGGHSAVDVYAMDAGQVKLRFCLSVTPALVSEESLKNLAE